MSLSIRVHHDDGAMVVALAGAADASMLQPLQEPLTAALSDADTVVLDLDGMTTLDTAELRDVIIAVVDTARGGHLRIAAGHAQTVLTLAQARIHHLVPVHRTVGDALAAERIEPASSGP